MLTIIIAAGIVTAYLIVLALTWAMCRSAALGDQAEIVDDGPTCG